MEGRKTKNESIMTATILSTEQKDFLTKARLLWRKSAGGHALKRSIGVVEKVLETSEYAEPQRIYINNVRDWYISHQAPELVVGDWVRIIKSDIDKLGEIYSFEYIPYRVDELAPSCEMVTMLSGHPCSLIFKRFTLIKKYTQ